MEKKILVAEDEKNIANIIAYNLKNDGYKVFCAYDGQEALDLFESEKPDLVLLDIMMPKINGFDVCKQIRKKSQVAIIMLTARADEVDKVLGLELGADDYVTKPFSVNELMARVKANLRRSDNNCESNIVSFGDIKIDFNRYEVFCNDKMISLTPKEFDLLKFLAIHPNKIFNREELLNKVWSYEYFGDARTVDVTVRRLRMKVEKTPDDPKFILTKRGVGYYFEFKK